MGGHKPVAKAICFALIVFLQYWTIEWSAKSLAEMFQCEQYIYLVIGIFTVLFADVVFLLLTGRIAPSLTIVSGVSLILGITNFYVNKWYGEPFSLEELANAATAFAVLDSYTFSLGRIIIASATLSKQKIATHLGTCYTGK